MSHSLATNMVSVKAISTTKTHSSVKDCEICGIFSRLLEKPDFRSQLSRSEAFKEDCAIHTPILKWVEDEYTKSAQLEAKAGYRSSNLDLDGFQLLRSEDKLPTISAIDEKFRPQYPFQIIKHKRNELETANKDSCTSVMNPNWVDLGIAKTWIEKCFTECKSRCNLPASVQHISPTWLIDTVENCLVPGTTNNEFIALSYRWGSSTTPHMTRAIFNKMTVPGGLLKGDSFLTPTVRNAIKTVRGLGERFLWVDAICLAPEDNEHMSQQLQLMGAIYASAKLTIVALDGDASTGLQGVEGESPRRTLPNIFPWKDDTNLMLRHHPELSALDVKASQYFTRGWTYQEYMLSRRRLIFGKQQIHWKCSCAAYHEDLPHIHDEEKGRSIRPRSLGFPNIKKGFTDIREFGILINEYNARQLKYSEDAHPAASGFLTYIGKLAFPGGFLLGLPRLYFGIALMWTIEFGNNSPKSRKWPGLARRAPSKRDHSILPDTHLPSWSWIGWSGYGVHILDKEAQFQWADLGLSENSAKTIQIIKNSRVTISIAEWFSCNPLNLKSKQPLPHSPTVFEQGEDPPYDRSLWTRKLFDPNIHGDTAGKIALSLGLSGKYVYEHINLPGRYFWWPISPTRPIEQSISADSGQTPFITSRVRRARLRAVRGVGYSKDIKMDTHLRILDKIGRLCGWLQLQNNDEVCKFPEAEIEDGMCNYIDHLGIEGVFVSQMLEPLELVAICLSKFCDIDKIGDEIEYKEFYDVLWIEWTDGIAYRKGCGFVKKELWEDQDLEGIDLIMG